MEIPDELYRRIKAKSALEGRPIREVAIELFQSYLDSENAPPPDLVQRTQEIDGEPVPPWFGILRPFDKRDRDHSLEAILKSIARGVSRERDL